MSNHGPRPILDGQLTATDFPQTSVTVVLQDGSTCRFRTSFYHREEDWICVYTEHCGYHMFPLAAVSSIKGAVRTDDDRFALL